MRVLHVSHSAMPGGSNEVLLSLIRHRPQDVTCACVFLQAGPVEAAAREAGAATAIVDAGRAREFWHAPRVVRQLRGAIRAHGAGLVFGHVSKAHLYASVAARLEGTPYVFRQPERRGQKVLMHELAGRLPAAAVVCSSNFTAAEQRARWPGAPVLRVHPGREVAELPPPRVHRAGAADAVVLGVVGRLQRWKRVELVLRALPAVLAEVPHARLRVIGDAWPGLDEDYPGWLREEARRLGVERAVEFTGHVAGADAAMLELDALVHAAELEPFGLVLVEAMLRGVPVVAPAAGGPAEIVRDGVDGLLVDPERSADLAAAIVALAVDPQRRTAMGAEGRRRALERFSAERMARDLWAVGRAVATGARPTAGD
jgi:glycosyltransferase involved in cell wall biosynthesis